MIKISPGGIFIFLLFFSLNSFSQLLYNLIPKQNAVSLSNGWNRNEPLTTFSYARGVHINLLNIIKDDVTLFLDFSDKTDFRTDNSFRIIYGGQGNLFKIRSFNFIFRKTFGITWYKLPQNVRATYVGAEFELLPGFYKKKYFVALDLYYGDNLRGHLSNSDAVDEVVKELGQGWFKPHLATFRTGINIGLHFKEHWTVYGNVDFFIARPKTTGSYYPITPLFFGYAGVNYIFPKTKLDHIESAP